MADQQHTECPNCRNQEVERLKADLYKCREAHKSKDKKIKQLDKKVFVLTFIAVAIGAIFGKEALDTIIEWMQSIGDFNSSVNHMTSHNNLPAPGTLAVFAIPLLVCRKSRKRK
jgi:H+/Cl- antiporter ClcA